MSSEIGAAPLKGQVMYSVWFGPPNRRRYVLFEILADAQEFAGRLVTSGQENVVTKSLTATILEV